MSRRLLQRGRYPKAPGVEHVGNTNSQYAQNPTAAASQMPFYDPSLQPMTTQSSWVQPQYPDPNAYHQPTHPTYPDPNVYQHNQVQQQPVPDGTTYWSGNQMLPMSSQAPWNESWNYKPETAPDSAANYSNYQQPGVPQAEQWQQQPALYQQNTNLNYPPPQQPPSGLDQNYPTEYEHQEYQTSNNSNVIAPNATPPWENGTLEATQPEQISWGYDANQYSQNTGLDLNDPNSALTLPSEPNNYVGGTNLEYNNPGGVSANYLPANAENASASTSRHTSHNPSPSIEQIEGSCEPIDLQYGNFEPVRDKASPIKQQFSEYDCASSTLAAFFQNPDDQEVLRTQQPQIAATAAEPDSISSAEESSQNDVSSALRDNVPAAVSGNADELASHQLTNSRVVNSQTGASVLVDGNSIECPREVVNYLEDSRFVDNQWGIGELDGISQHDTSSESLEQVNGSDKERNFVQEERMLNVNLEENQSSSSISSSGFIEEPINQEVPEPHRDESSAIQPQSLQEYKEIITEEPPNQQIPPGSGQTSRSTSSERERIVIRPREDSPFKPPRPSSSKSIVVQQEAAMQPPPPESKPPKDKTIVQEVNLETFPDNLERPSDYEELRKQSPLYSSRKQHLRSDLNSSPSSLLCDNLSIPCVTLAPAAPPLSYAKSDRSESSTDSRAENVGVGGMPALKSVESSLSGSSCDILEVETNKTSSKEQHMPAKENSSSIQPLRTKETSRSDWNQSETSSEKQDRPNLEKDDSQKPVYLKDTRINGSSREPTPLRQAVSNSEIPDSRLPPSRNPNRDSKYHSDKMIDARYDHPESNRQRFADQKYPSFDDRQYYSDRERSRPSSRSSVKEGLEEYPYQPFRGKPDEQTPYRPRAGDPNRPEDYRPRDGAPNRPEDYRPRDGVSNRPEDYRPTDGAPNRPEDYRPRDGAPNRPEDYRPRDGAPNRPEDYRPRDGAPNRPEDYYWSRSGDSRRYSQDHGRPSSRLSNDSDTRRSDSRGYYQQPYGYPPNAYPRYNAEFYNRPPPQNPRDYSREYDPYQRDPYYSSYYDAYRYAYSNYNYGFYDEFYRNDPRYKQYQEQCRQYYAKYGREMDYERSSVHSGHSSVNELSKDITQGSLYQPPDIDSNESEFSGYNLEQNYSYSDGQNEISNTEAASTPSSRLTPAKFSYPHPIARFSPGGMFITAIPNQISTSGATTIRIHNLQVIREEEDSFKELKNYQGPLVRGLTHKNDVIEFCSQKIKNIQLAEDVVDRDSYVLLWELMVLLLRQNGSVAGSDIAELLLKDHEVLRPPTLPLKQNEAPQGEHSPADINDASSQSHGGDVSSPDEGIVVFHDRTTLNTSGTVDVNKITRKFREFLLFGHKKDALEWAMKHGLWGHALFLASKMDLRTYANVMTRFANSLALNDPLQTLYQLMSGRQPLAVTNVADKKWGDWRPHLAMILSNPSSLPDVDSRSITTLGDTLANKGCLCAAHFCYIMAQVEFGTYENTSSKFVLLASDHSLPFEEFATNEAVQITEIYEYAQSLANQGYLLVHLQFYKFLYALRLVEHGFLEEALHYCEIIAGKVQAHPHFFQMDFVSEVFNLATLLKYHDPHFLRGQGEFEDQDDPDWLKNLAYLVQNFNNFPAYEPPQPYIEQQPPEMSQSQSANNLQVAPQSPENLSYNNVPGEVPQMEANNSYANNQMNYQPNQWSQQSSLQNSTFSPSNSSLDNTGYHADSTFTNQSSFHRQNSLPSQEENETTDVPSSPVTQSPPFDYYSSGTQQNQMHEKSSMFEASNSYNNMSERQRRDSAMSAGSRYSSGSTSVANKPPKKETKPEIKKDKQNTQAGKTWLGGIFSRLMPKAPNQMILPDDKNPTIVWDEVNSKWVNKDSNDDDEANAPLAPPTDMELMGSSKSSTSTFHSPMPPTSTYAAPSASMPPASNTSMPANKFQRPKTKGMRQNYVDVLSTSGATKKANVIPEALFPSPYESGAPPQMFSPTPTSAAHGETSASDFEQNHVSYSTPPMEREEPIENQATPMMFDPAAFDSRRPNTANQRPMLGQTGRRTYPT